MRTVAINGLSDIVQERGGEQLLVVRHEVFA